MDDKITHFDLILAILWAHPSGIERTHQLQHLALKCNEVLGLGWDWQWQGGFFGPYNTEITEELYTAVANGFACAIHSGSKVTYRINAVGRKIVKECLSKIMDLDKVKETVKREWRTAKGMGLPRECGGLH